MTAPEVVGVAGAGTMGAGIAQIAAVAGHPVVVYDSAPGAAERAVAAIRDRVRSLAAKGRVDAGPDRLRLRAASTVAGLADADVIVEAVAEDLAVKRALFAELERMVRPECVLATNTSSLSPTALAAQLAHPQRVVGMHFFNPVPVMKLVEVVPGLATAEPVCARVAALARSWGKVAVRSAATPGFIVNRVARPFYAEAWRLQEERAAGPEVIDTVLTGAGGFRMGPFALMDLIGHDVNDAVTRTVWQGFGHDPRFAPSLAQRALVDAGRLGRKTGDGVYSYRNGGQPPAAAPAEPRKAPEEVIEHGARELRALLRRARVPVLEGEHDGGYAELPHGAVLVRSAGVPAAELAAAYGRPVVVADRALDDGTATCLAVAGSDDCTGEQLGEAVGLLQAAGMDVFIIDDVPGLIIARTVAMLVNLAADALHHGVASARDIDTAMRLGTNYPIGPLEWGDRWGADVVLRILDGLSRSEGDPRYRASTLLRRRAASGGRLS